MNMIEKMKQIIDTTKELFDLSESDMKPIDETIGIFDGHSTKAFLKLVVDSRSLNVKQKAAISYMIGAFFTE